MFERAYRQRLEADLTRWQADGVITPASGEAIRRALPALPPAVTLGTVAAIVGGLLIAAACLAFVAANWQAIARLVRLAILAAGLLGAYGIGAAFAQRGRTMLADLAVTVGSIIFGASIALVGQMYHLGGDFAGGMMLWSAGALIAAAATGSRGAIAVALVAACLWSGMRLDETGQGPHLPFVPFWLIAAVLAILWRSVVAGHFAAVALAAWWGATAIVISDRADVGLLVLACGAVLMLGAGLAFAAVRRERFRVFGATVSHYGAFLLAGVAAIAVTGVQHDGGAGAARDVSWAIACGVAGVVLACVPSALGRRAGAALAAIACTLVLIVSVNFSWSARGDEPWLVYALLLAAMACLLASGIVDGVRPRIVAGWLGLGATIAGITWGVRGSLLRRALFLAVAGLAVVDLAVGLGRLSPKETR